MACPNSGDCPVKILESSAILTYPKEENPLAIRRKERREALFTTLYRHSYGQVKIDEKGARTMMSGLKKRGKAKNIFNRVQSGDLTLVLIFLKELDS
ncbi:MAG: hypothetical protein LBO66_01190 [Deltaproteobacteria bacterium]|nr:hypothetical protein [Deltaproteobacteria bacterium]